MPRFPGGVRPSSKSRAEFAAKQKAEAGFKMRDKQYEISKLSKKFGKMDTSKLFKNFR